MMGMFDYVEFETDCPKCGRRVANFQTKDGECIMATLSPLDVLNFYSNCGGCGAWIEYVRRYPRAQSLDDFTQTVETHGDTR